MRSGKSRRPVTDLFKRVVLARRWLTFVVMCLSFAVFGVGTLNLFNVFRANVDAVDLYMSISGLAYFFLSNQHTLSWLLDRDLAARRRVLKRRQHVVEMVLSYLTQASPAEVAGADSQ